MTEQEKMLLVKVVNDSQKIYNAEAITNNPLSFAALVAQNFLAAVDTERAKNAYGFVREIRPGEWKFSKTCSWGPEVWLPLYTSPIGERGHNYNLVLNQLAQVVKGSMIDEFNRDDNGIENLAERCSDTYVRNELKLHAIASKQFLKGIV